MRTFTDSPLWNKEGKCRCYNNSDLCEYCLIFSDRWDEAEEKRKKRNMVARERTQAMKDLGLVRGRTSGGKILWE